MKRYIKGITQNTLKRIEELAPRIKGEYADIERTFDNITLYDVTLDDAVIIKIHDDRLTLILGSKIEIIEFSEFYSLVVI